MTNPVTAVTKQSDVSWTKENEQLSLQCKKRQKTELQYLANYQLDDQNCQVITQLESFQPNCHQLKTQKLPNHDHLTCLNNQCKPNNDKSTETKLHCKITDKNDKVKIQHSSTIALEILLEIIQNCNLTVKNTNIITNEMNDKSVKLISTYDCSMNAKTKDLTNIVKISPPDPVKYRSIVMTIWPTTVKLEWDNKSYEQIYSNVRSTGLPNYMEARLSLESGLNIQNWRLLLGNYHDKQLVEFLEYGWPVDYTHKTPPSPTYINHKEPEEYSTHINKYIETELKHKALLGPFINLPFHPWCQFSPIMTRKKKQSIDRRIIVDLSFPHGHSVNSGIKKGYYQGHELTYTLPGINDIINKLKITYKKQYIWSIDLARAYRQLRTDPLSVPLLGILFKGKKYFDIAPPFGCRTSSMACARTTNAIVYLLNKMNFFVVCYLDDFIGVEKDYESAKIAYTKTLNLLAFLGLDVSYKKCVPPTTNLTWLGYNIDSEKLIITIPKDKIVELIEECKLWKVGSKVTRKYIQHIAGKLNFIAKCVKATKVFMNRILQFLRNSPFKGSIQITPEVMHDINWFITFAEQFNGLILLPKKDKTNWEIQCDACLKGGGAFSVTNYLSEKFNDAFMELNLNIAQIEAINIIVSLIVLCPQDPQNYDIQIITDNMAAMQVLTGEYGKDKILTACGRFLWKFSALNNCKVIIKHKPGVTITIADALSRAFIDKKSKLIATNYCLENCIDRLRCNHFKVYENILTCI